MGDSDEEMGDVGSPRDFDDEEFIDDVKEDDEFVDIGEPNSEGKAIPKDQRTTSKFMTKYERARILGVRALQISMNAPVMVELEPTDTDPLQIAMKELRQKKIPIIIRRYLPHGDYEDWSVDELLIEDRE
mmetsp:Transcript_5528/g.7166  ORF Transcript_5528/g.7166 Transcript_5528/m.7166 type:complete len:130 (+) Transcript_5528:68-457(+)|eukprot:CAMPEP_0201487648 /NCGR_PEP_ID=MMETSP0151_2-20130828/14574_1 /ASSEMBLY_ACC=CAM_ASM_000257 /TAXON_ID=200890 /ORGANISM="Paramoeba atlantica, Strain 621/1 / CCAP 1560/9" /LENGTH=129 /DNA_ID=CAMNT_0047872755 /DNA_START=42 /DNA_END=431 /DNA_ORIENTATION=+